MQSAFTIGGTILVITLVAGIVAFLFIFSNRNWKHQREKQLLQTQFQQALLQTQIEIQSQTLQTISQEIHDNVGQVLSLVKLNLSTLKPEEEKKLLDTKQLVSKAINDLRDLSRSLYGNKIAELGLPDAIDNELKILQNSGQFKTSFKTEGQRFKLEPQKEMVLYRMLQESLNNAIKHSKAQNISVVLNYSAGLFELTITDDGVGFDTHHLPVTESGMGLKSMQSRAALIGAQFFVESSKNNGTSINIKLPTLNT
jgi:two-component system, NarL family, sensor kinase